MELVDIQELKKGVTGVLNKFELTFSDEDGNDCMKIVISKDDIIQIKNYFINYLSYGAQLKNEIK